MIDVVDAGGSAVTGAGMFDLAAEFGTEDRPRGPPLDHPERFGKKANTPTLILQGENDATNPIGESTALYRALKRVQRGDRVGCVYLLEPQGLRQEKRQLDIYTPDARVV